MLTVDQIIKSAEFMAQTGGREDRPTPDTSALKPTTQGTAELIEAGKIEHNPVASLLSPELPIEYNAEIILQAERAALTKGIASILGNWEKTKAIAEKLGITIEECQNRYRTALRTIAGSYPIEKNASRMYFVDVPTPDGKFLHTESIGITSFPSGSSDSSVS